MESNSETASMKQTEKNAEVEATAKVIVKTANVTIEDCADDPGDDAEVAIVIIAPVTEAEKQQSEPAEVAVDEDEVEIDVEIETESTVEAVDGDEDVTETVKVIEKTVPTADGGTETTITTIKMVKKQVVEGGDEAAKVVASSPSASTNSSRRSSNTTTTAGNEKSASAATSAVDAADGPSSPSAPIMTKTVVKQDTIELQQEQKKAKPQALSISNESEEEDEEEMEEKEEEEDAHEAEQVKAKTKLMQEPEKEAAAHTVVQQKKPIIMAENQTPTVAEIPTPAPIVVPEPSAIAVKSEKAPEEAQQKQDNLNNTIKEIISDIDSNIQEQENVTLLKQQQQQLLLKQQELAQQIRQQQLLAQKLAAENRAHQQLLQQQQQQHQQQQQQQQQQQYQPPQLSQPQQAPISHVYSPQQNVSKYSTIKETQDEHGYTRRVESYESEESSNASKHIDLHKIFTPATDAPEILPKNRKLYASSAFYAPGLHPTVEDQVELARRISHSLSDISNQKSKGQSMYVNRKKRSVKWVHEGCGQDAQDIEDYEKEYKENTDLASATTNGASTQSHGVTLDKVPLRFLMNPRGQMHDITTMRDTLNAESALLSPDKCAELVIALQTQKGKGAELFAKRRKKSENWVVNESNGGTQSPSGLPDYQQYQPKPPTSPNILPAYSDAGKHRVQLNMHQEQVLERYAKPGLKVVKTPWEAALETGSASTAFVEEKKVTPLYTPTAILSPAPAPQYHDVKHAGSPYAGPSTMPDYEHGSLPQHKLSETQSAASKPTVVGGSIQRDLAYKPSIPQGWRAPSVTLPKELYTPKEIPLGSYAPPPVVNIQASVAPYNDGYDQQHSWKASASPLLPTTTSSGIYGSSNQYADFYGSPPAAAPIQTAGFPLAKPSSSGFSTSGSAAPPKQQYWAPNSYQKVPQQSNQAVPQVNFNPSPLSYDKLAKFENVAENQQQQSPYSYSPQPRRLMVQSQGAKVRNLSPTPYGGVYSPALGGGGGSSSSHTPNSFSPRPPSQTYGGSYGSNDGYVSGSTPSSARFSANEILHGQNYNNTARGWPAGSGAPACGAGYGIRQPTKTPMSVTTGGGSSLPYTDF